MVCDIQLAAERTGAAVILAGNFIKGLLPDINRGIGGTELYNTLRCILTLRPDDGDDPSVRILEATKMSLMAVNVPSDQLDMLKDQLLLYFLSNVMGTAFVLVLPMKGAVKE